MSLNFRSFLNFIIFIFPILFILGIFLDKLNSGPFGSIEYFILIVEDGPLEYIQAIAFFLSFIFASYLAFAFFKKHNKSFGFLFILMAFSFIFVSGEEISWGQRIFSLDASEFSPENLQKEINIHNLPEFWQLFLMLHTGISLYGAIGWIVFRPKKNKTLILFRRYFIPCPILIFYFIPFFMIGFLTDPNFNTNFSLETFTLPPDISVTVPTWYNLIMPGDKEIAEFLMSLGILFFILTSFYRIKKINY